MCEGMVGVVLERINRAICVESVSGGRGRRAYWVLGARGDEDGMVPGPRRLVMRVGEFRVDSGRLLRVVHRIGVLLVYPRNALGLALLPCGCSSWCGSSLRLLATIGAEVCGRVCVVVGSDEGNRGGSRSVTTRAIDHRIYSPACGKMTKLSPHVYDLVLPCSSLRVSRFSRRVLPQNAFHGRLLTCPLCQCRRIRSTNTLAPNP